MNKKNLVLIAVLISSVIVLSLIFLVDINKSANLSSDFYHCNKIRSQQECWDQLEVDMPVLFSTKIVGQVGLKAHLLKLADAPSSYDGYHVFYSTPKTRC